MKWILRLKHWQLFLLIIIPLAWTSPSPLKEFVNTVGMLFFALWVYSIGISGYNKMPETTRFPMNTTLFKINAVGSVVLLLMLLLFSPNEQSQSTLLTIVITVGGLLFIYCTLYIIYYASKILAIIGYHETTNRIDIFAYFFSFCFLIFGVWYIQPKVNRIFSPTSKSIKTHY